MTTGPDFPPIEDRDLLMRRVRPSEITTDQENGPRRPSSDAFKQDGAEGETSVYLLSETTPEQIIAEYPGIYVAVVEAGLLRQLGLEIERGIAGEGLGHCVITGRKTRSILRAISRACYWAPGYGPEDRQG